MQDTAAGALPAGPGAVASKVPAVTFGFWIVKILATTLGETGGDALSMQLGLGYLASSLLLLVFFVIAVAAQLRTRRFHPLAYWVCVVATTTVGTTTSDYLDRTLGLGYPLASLLMFATVVGLLLLWRRATGRIAVDPVTKRADEAFYWGTILVSNTLGTALGDFSADDLGLGFGGGALLFAGLIALVALLRLATRLPTTLLFWAAYVLTRPLGATLGDILTKPPASGGLGLDRLESSLVIAAAMALGLWLARRRLPR
jgi:uncharacterized membrane-anchored protein